MSASSRRLEGRWRELKLGPELWCIRREAPRADVYAVDVTDRRPLPMPLAAIEPGLEIEWSAESVRLTLRAPDRAECWTARQALIHESLPALYDELPLERFDVGARRFWNRVFLLARLPGGRRLLGWLARRRRGPG